MRYSRGESIEKDIDDIRWEIDRVSEDSKPHTIIDRMDRILAAAERIKIIARLRQAVEVVKNDD